VPETSMIPNNDLSLETCKLHTHIRSKQTFYEF